MAKGWKGYANAKNETVPDARYKHYPNATQRDYTAPVWITPLIEGDDPVPGETWRTRAGTKVEILSPSYHGVVVVGGLRDYPVGYDAELLEPLPEKKRYRVQWPGQDWGAYVEATDRDDLRACLAALADDAEVVG